MEGDWKEGERKREWLFLFFLLLLSFGLRLLHIYISPIISSDGVLYIEQAKSNFGKEATYFHLYPLIIRLFYLLIDDWELAARVVSVFFGTISILLFYLLIRLLLNPRLALCSSLFFGICPHVVEYSSDVLREPLFWSFFLSSLFFALLGFKRKKWYLFLISALFSLLSTLTRVEGIESALLVLLWGIYSAKENERERKELLFYSFLYLSFLVLFSLQGLIILKHLTGEIDSIQLILRLKSLTLEASPISILNEIEKMEILHPTLGRFFEIAYRFRYVSVFLEIAFKYLKLIGPVFLVFLAFGVGSRRFDLGTSKYFLLMWVILSLLFSYIHTLQTYYFSARHGLNIAIPTFVWMAKGLEEMAYLLMERLKRTPFFSQPNFNFRHFLIILLILVVLPFAIKPYRLEKLELKKAGFYLRQNGFSGKRIATFPKYSRVLFYAEASPLLLKGKDGPSIREEMRKTGVEYILLDSHIRKAIFPQTDSLSFGFSPVRIPEFGSLKRYSLELYRLNE